MIRYEIKKIFSKSLSKVSLVVLLFSLLISCYFAITNVSFWMSRANLIQESQQQRVCGKKSRSGKVF